MRGLSEGFDNKCKYTFCLPLIPLERQCGILSTIGNYCIVCDHAMDAVINEERPIHRKVTQPYIMWVIF